MTNTNVAAVAPNTLGLLSFDETESLTNVVRLSGGSLTSAEFTAIEAEGPLKFTASNGAVVTGGGGLLVDAFDNTGAGVGAFQPTLVRITASGGSILTGDARAESESELDIDLETGSHWTGASLAATNVSVDPTSRWTIPARSGCWIAQRGWNSPAVARSSSVAAGAPTGWLAINSPLPRKMYAAMA